MGLIIFDFDGVLADTLDNLIQFGQEACDELGVKRIVNKEDLSHIEIMFFAMVLRFVQPPIGTMVSEYVFITK